MGYVSLYRKYRSQTFSDLIGQNHVVRTLQNGIATGRIAHAYLFTGPRGTGKTSSARLLAKALCCEHGPTPEPDNTCEICASITQGSCVDVIEMDAASEAGVDQVRETIVEVIEYKPMVARYKVFIIDEVHDLSAKAFDALLKTIEEPPPHVIFILATTEYNKVPATIRSRCQKFEFHRASLQDLTTRLNYVVEKEGVQAEPAALSAIARMADGGYRDALTLLEQAMITSDGQITLQQVYDQLGLVSEEIVDRLLLAMKSADVPAIGNELAEVARRGRDPRAVLESMLYRLSDLTRVAYGVEVGAGDATQEAALHESAARVGREQILTLRGELAEAHRAIRDITLPRLWLESELIRISLRMQSPATPVSNAIASTTAVIQQAPANKQKAPEAPPKKAEPVAQVEPPKAEPKPEAPTGAPELKEPAKEPELTGDSDLDKARALWAAVQSELPSTTSIAMKLHGSKVVAAKGHELVVEMERQMECDWITEKPQRLNHILQLLKKIGGADYRVVYRTGAKKSELHEPQAVELPVEGEKLAQMAREILGGL